MTFTRACSIASLLACACFSDPPSTGDGDGGTGSSTSDTPTSTSDTATTSEASTVGVDSSTSSASSGASESGEVGESGAESSTGAPACTCESNAVLCESFEAPFSPTDSPWAIPMGGGSVDPVVVDDPTSCGPAALRTAVATGDLYSVINAEVEIDPSFVGHRLAASLWIEAGCLIAPTRAMLVQFPSDSGIWYQFSVWMSDGQLELRMQNALGQFETEPAIVPLQPAHWHRVELEVSVSTEPPSASVYLDGDVVIAAVEGPPLQGRVVFEPLQAINLGIYRDDLPFAVDCGVTYDDVELSAP